MQLFAENTNYHKQNYEQKLEFNLADSVRFASNRIKINAILMIVFSSFLFSKELLLSVLLIKKQTCENTVPFYEMILILILKNWLSFELFLKFSWHTFKFIGSFLVYSLFFFFLKFDLQKDSKCKQLFSWRLSVYFRIHNFIFDSIFCFVIVVCDFNCNLSVILIFFFIC